MVEDPHSVLGVEPGASQADIKRAYQKLAKETHPDREGGSAEAFRRVREAFEQLDPGQLDREIDRHLDALFRSMVKDYDPFENLIEQARHDVAQERQNVAVRISDCKQRVDRLSSLSCRVNSERFEEILQEEVQRLRGDLTELERGMMLLNAVLDRLEEYEDSEHGKSYTPGDILSSWA